MPDLTTTIPKDIYDEFLQAMWESYDQGDDDYQVVETHTDPDTGEEVRITRPPTDAEMRAHVERTIVKLLRNTLLSWRAEQRQRVVADEEKQRAERDFQPAIEAIENRT